MPPKSRKDSSLTRNRRREVAGIVVSDKMAKTISVRIERHVRHPMFGKTLRREYVCYAHDAKDEARAGDRVEIVECRPLSKKKHWRLTRIVTRAPGAPELDARAAARPEVTETAEKAAATASTTEGTGTAAEAPTAPPTA